MRRIMLAATLLLSVPAPALAGQEGGRTTYHDDGGGGYYEEDRYASEDRNRNRNRNRGAFSPGPFDDSPVDAFNGNVVCLPGSTCYADRRGEEPPPEERPS
jgi:hypothetical protein